MTFQGPILVPKVAFWGLWGLVCIEKWSRKFVSSTRSAIFGTPEMAKMTLFWPFCVFLIFLPHFPLSTGHFFQL